MKQILAFVCVVSVTLWMAAGSHAAPWTAGIKGGVNIGELYGDDAPDSTSMRTGFAGGAFAGTQLGERFGIRLELLYVQKGVEGEFVIPGDDHGHDSIVRLDYVEIPFLFTARFPAGEKFAFGLFAGPTMSFNTTAEVEDLEHGETVDIKDSVESFEFGATAGGSIEYVLPSFSLLADVRYGIGTTTVTQDAEGQSLDVKNRGVGIMAGVAFPLGHR